MMTKDKALTIVAKKHNAESFENLITTYNPEFVIDFIKEAMDLYAVRSNPRKQDQEQVEGVVNKVMEGNFTGSATCEFCDAKEVDGHEVWCPEVRG